MNLSNLILQRAARDPEAVAVIEDGHHLRYADLSAGVLRVSAALAARGVGRGVVVGLLSAHVVPHLILTLAIARAGAVSMPAGSGATLDERLRPLRAAGARLVLCERVPAADEGGEGFEFVAADESLLRAGSADASAGWVPDEGDSVWRLTLSSGTTGEAKIIPLTHEHSITHLLAHNTVLRYGPDTRLFFLLGMNTSFALLHCLQQLLHGGGVVAYSSQLIDAIALCRAHGVTHMLASPASAAALADRVADASVADGPPLPDLQLYLGGGAVSDALRATLARKVTPRVGIVYGSSELGLVAIADAQTFARHPRCAGRLVPWALAEAVDAQGKALPPGTRGELRFQFLGRFDGYLGDPQATARHLRDGWYYPGDLGRVERDGLLYVDGRVNELVNVGGDKFLASSVEQALETHPDVVEAGVVAADLPTGGRVLLAVVVSRGAFDEAAILEHVRPRLGRRTPARVFRADALPRNEMGKLVRARLAQGLSNALGGRAG
ncbi:MAG: class I adenylate-forming enzyme family protein [Burkholderiaceae bacterium]